MTLLLLLAVGSTIVPDVGPDIRAAEEEKPEPESAQKQVPEIRSAQEM